MIPASYILAAFIGTAVTAGALSFFVSERLDVPVTTLAGLVAFSGVTLVAAILAYA